MEGNECYKFSTIRNFLEHTDSAPVRVILDIGANVGTVSAMMALFFPEATIYAFEPVREYFDLGTYNTSHLKCVHWFHGAVSAQHKFVDDLGQEQRAIPADLRVLKGLPEGGPGWAGGSIVVAEDATSGIAIAPKGYERLPGAVTIYELETFLNDHDIQEIDLMKMDCEGCEHSVLGSASPELLSRFRFIVGEYHGIERFSNVMRARLFSTHKVNLIGNRDLGCFFAERLDGTRDGILCYNMEGMLQSRPWLCEQPLAWHLFNDEYVLPDERCFHALL